MDAHVFRLIALELAAFLRGARLETIHSPVPGLLVLGVYNYGQKRNLVLRHERARAPGQEVSTPLKFGHAQEPCLYWSDLKLPNPERPSGLVMSLRKHLAGCRLGTSWPDWARRRLVIGLRLPPSRSLALGAVFLTLDLREGGYLGSEAPLEDSAALWPDFELIRREHRELLLSEAFIRTFPLLTPPLRRTLLALDGPEAAVRLADLAHESGCGSGALYLYLRGEVPHILSAWPLPRALREGLREEVVLYREEARVGGASGNFPCLEAARRLYEPKVLASLNLQERTFAAWEEKKAARRLRSALDKLDQEERRLRALAALREKAILVQGRLWQHGREEKLAALTVAAEENPTGRELVLDLDAGLTLRQNMEKMFRQADKGARGLVFVAGRRAELAANLESLRQGEDTAPRKALSLEKGGSCRRTGGIRAGGARVRRFTSSDGFTVLRGRSAEGNRDLLRLARPQDIWLHVRGGPGAHVLIRREHLGVEVPERTLREAGTLAALKSWRSKDSRAEIVSALAKDVRAPKGGAPGLALVDREWKSFVVELEEDLEARLASRPTA
ncbi:MAG: NFACT RNA binding domain-containing protein [Desulfovibrionaceae bacterium]|nr:NFACT RNA binding domain-containing protein [Desulfovibrionaceae bacterium]